MAEGILVQEPDAEVDIISGEQGNADGLVESSAGNEESKKNLRDQLRRTLSKKESFTGTSDQHGHCKPCTQSLPLDVSAFRRKYSEKSFAMQEVAQTPGLQALDPPHA